jgi:hypothetical protein
MEKERKIHTLVCRKTLRIAVTAAQKTEKKGDDNMET